MHPISLSNIDFINNPLSAFSETLLLINIFLGGGNTRKYYEIGRR